MQFPEKPSQTYFWTKIILVVCGALLAAVYWSKSKPREQPAARIAAGEIRGAPINAAPEAPAALPESPTEVRPDTPVSPPPAAEADAADADGFVSVSFDRLASFEFEMPDESNGPTPAAAPAKEQIPAPIKALDNKRVALKGFMLPLKVEGGLITELLVMRDQSMCCYGTVPKINEWVSVRMTNKGVKPVMDQAITLFGTLHVGEMRENGYLVGLYQLDGEKMTVPLE